jgi:hypothetical protein
VFGGGLWQVLRVVSLASQETEVTHTTWRQDFQQGFAESRRQQEEAEEVGEAGEVQQRRGEVLTTDSQDFIQLSKSKSKSKLFTKVHIVNL